MQNIDIVIRDTNGNKLAGLEIPGTQHVRVTDVQAYVNLAKADDLVVVTLDLETVPAPRVAVLGDTRVSYTRIVGALLPFLGGDVAFTDDPGAGRVVLVVGTLDAIADAHDLLAGVDDVMAVAPELTIPVLRRAIGSETKVQSIFEWPGEARDLATVVLDRIREWAVEG